jgi:hypothetical protein
MANGTSTAAEITSRPTTLLALVQALTDEINSPTEVALAASRLIGERRVVLTGNFAGQQIEFAEVS